MLLFFGWGMACAGTVERPMATERVAQTAPGTTAISVPKGSQQELRAQIVRNAEAMIGTPYRYGGSTPAGFDCSGLVLFSYARAGVEGLPRTARTLEDRADSIQLSQLRPADLLFFRLDGRKSRHVAIYAGDRQFIHAPSPGKRVERVSFDHVYWREKLGRAGSLLP